MESGEKAGRESLNEEVFTKLVRGFLLGEEKTFIDGLRDLDISETRYLEVKRILEGEKRRKRIDEEVVMVSCPKCGFGFMLDSFIEVAFNGRMGEYRCPNCSTMVKYNFVEEAVEGFVEGETESSFLEVNLGELRRNVEKELLSFYSARVLGETSLMVAVRVKESKLMMLVREVACKISSEGWNANWSLRVEVSVDKNWQGKAVGALIFSSKWPSPQIEICSLLHLEKQLSLEGDLPRELARSCIDLENDAYEKLAAVLAEGKLAVEWIYPARAIIPSVEVTEEDFVSELKKKIKEKEVREERI